jgi:hypothetical protein
VQWASLANNNLSRLKPSFYRFIPSMESYRPRVYSSLPAPILINRHLVD